MHEVGEEEAFGHHGQGGCFGFGDFASVEGQGLGQGAERQGSCVGLGDDTAEHAAIFKGEQAHAEVGTNHAAGIGDVFQQVVDIRKA